MKDDEKIKKDIEFVKKEFISALWYYAAAINRNESKENLKEKYTKLYYKASIVDSCFEEIKDNYLLLLFSSAIYLLGLPSHSSILKNIEENEGGLFYGNHGDEDLICNILFVLLSTISINSNNKTEKDNEILSRLFSLLRKNYYSNGSKKELLLSDILLAVELKRCEKENEKCQ